MIFSTIIIFFDTGMYVFVCNHAGILKSTCYIDVRWFPFDIQKCDLKFGSWTHNGWLLDLQMQAVDISSYIPNGEWDLVGESPWHYYWDTVKVFLWVDFRDVWTFELFWQLAAIKYDVYTVFIYFIEFFS